MSQSAVPQPLLEQTLENVFNHIQCERMQGVPVLNQVLTVRALGFREWQQGQLGILLTPWFMNLMYVGGEGNSVGTTQQHILPSGPYEFITGYEDGIGYYQSCSLFSPMFEFDSQEAAELTAIHALDAVFNEEHQDTENCYPAAEVQQRWHDTASEQTEAAEEPEDTTADLTETLEKPMSRRDFLRGRRIKDVKTVVMQSGSSE